MILKGDAMKKITLPQIMRWTAVLIFLIGAGIGYDAGGKQLVVDARVIETFDL